MTIITFFIILFILILVHEFGHFASAKLFGVRVDEFGIGFPPRAWGKKFGETIYSLNWLPIGGFVKIFGENPDEESMNGDDRARSFVHKPKWQQAIVLVAGVTMNIFLAWVLLTSSFMLGIPTQVADEERDTVADARLLILQTTPDSPATAAGLMPSDQIIAVADAEGEQVSDMLVGPVIDFIASRPGEALELTLLRGGEEVVVTVTPEAGVLETDPERAVIGINLALAGIMRLPFSEAVVEGSRMTWELLVAITVGTLSFFADAFVMKADMSQVAGPVGIVGMVGDASQLGFRYLVTFTAFISLTLAVINLLPFPALDGGRLVFVMIEAVIRRPIPAIVTNTLNRAGFVLLLLLMAAVTVSDVTKLF